MSFQSDEARPWGMVYDLQDRRLLEVNKYTGIFGYSTAGEMSSKIEIVCQNRPYESL